MSFFHTLLGRQPPSSTPASALPPAVAAPEPLTAQPSPSIVIGETRVTPWQAGAARVMVTDGAPHPASAWAQVTAEHIAPIDPGIVGERATAARKFQLAIADALAPHHQKVIDVQRGKLAGVGDAHLDECTNGHDVAPHLDGAVAAIQAAAVGTPWEGKYVAEDVQALLRHELGVHFRSAQHIEHSWHVDRAVTTADAAKRPVSPPVARWLARHHPNHRHAAKGA